MVRTLALAALFAIGLAAGYILGTQRVPAPAAPAPTVREGVAWVNVPAIASRSQLSKQHALALKALRDELEQPLVELRREYIHLQRDGCSLTLPTEESIFEKSRKLTQKIEAELQRVDAQLKLEAQTQSVELQKQLAAVAEEVAHREGFRCVVLWTDAQPPGTPGTDLTEQVLTELNARFP